MFRQSGATYLPLRINSAGMIPLIFAFSIVILPGTIATYFATSTTWVGDVANFFGELLTYDNAMIETAVGQMEAMMSDEKSGEAYTLVVAVCKDIIARRLAVEQMEAFEAMPPDARAVFLELVNAKA